MPVIKSAKKKLRKDRKREEQRKTFEVQLKSSIKKAKAVKTEEAVRDAVIATDKAAKKHVIHKNKAARIKSFLSKLLGGKEAKKAESPKAEKKAPKKSTAKAKK